MNIKKKLTLLLASMVVCGSATAWTDNSSGGNFALSGVIKANSPPMVWSWKVGSSRQDFTASFQDLEAEGKVLNVKIPQIPILMAKSKTAFPGHSLLVAGSMPKIEFINAGNKIDIGASIVANVYFDLEIVDKKSPEKKLGTLQLIAKAAATYVVLYKDGTAKQYSLYSPDNAIAIFSGGLGMDKNYVPDSARWANIIITQFGGPDLSELESLVNKASGGTELKFDDAGVTSVERNSPVFLDITTFGAVAYALGIEEGNRVLKFTDPVTSETDWTVPLNIAITYS